jgi:hypothetical protein
MRITINKSVFNQPFVAGGQSARLARDLSDPTYFTPPRNIPIHSSPRVYAASDVVSDLPINGDARRQVVQALEFGSSYDSTYSAVKRALESSDRHLQAEVLRRVRSFFSTKKALQDEGGRSIGGNDLFDRLDQAIAEAKRQIADQRKLDEDAKKKDKRIKQGAVAPVSGARSEYDTMTAQAEAWLATASDAERKAAVKRAKSHIKKNGLAMPTSEKEMLALAAQGGEKLDDVLDGQIKLALDEQEKMTATIRDAVREQREAVVARINKDRDREINRAFSELPADLFTEGGEHYGKDITKQSVREEIVLSQGFTPKTEAVSDDIELDDLLDRATTNGVFDGKEARRFRTETLNHADDWLESKSDDWKGMSSRKVSQVKPSETKPKPEPSAEGAPSAEGEGEGDGAPSAEEDEQVIAIGPRGGKIIGYRSNGTPIYSKKKGGAPAPAQDAAPAPAQDAAPAPAPAQDQEQEQDDTPNYYRPVERNVPMSRSAADETPINKSLNDAMAFASQVLKKSIVEGRIIKSKIESMISDLDDTYDRIVAVRPHMEAHHTAMHNEAIHKLRDAHANPSPSRTKSAIAFADHFIEVVVREHNMANAELKECEGKKEKPKVKKALVNIGAAGIVTADTIAKVQRARVIKSAINAVIGHNMICPAWQEIDIDEARSELLKAGNAKDCANDMIDKAKDRIFGDDSEDALERLLAKVKTKKGVVTDEDGDDADVDDDDFDTDDDQRVEEVSEGIDPDGDEDDEDDDEGDDI